MELRYNRFDMRSLSIFVSCGQFTTEERRLGRAIVKLVDEIPGMRAYFADEVQDLNALESNILAKLHEADAFITVMHPRGEIKRPDGPPITRASVWIEQEIAIATYIRQIEKRPLPVIAFRHCSVGLEGIRGLIQLNPIEFKDEMEVLAALPALLEKWKNVSPSGIRVEVTSTKAVRNEDRHAIRQLVFTVVNDGNTRLREISGLLQIPAGILKHWSAIYSLQDTRSKDGRYRIFRFNEAMDGALHPHSAGRVAIFEYCTRCAVDDTGDSELIGAAIVDEQMVEITAWVEGKEYRAAKTMKELLIEANRA